MARTRRGDSSKGTGLVPCAETDPSWLGGALRGPFQHAELAVVKMCATLQPAFEADRSLGRQAIKLNPSYLGRVQETGFPARTWVSLFRLPQVAQATAEAGISCFPLPVRRGCPGGLAGLWTEAKRLRPNSPSGLFGRMSMPMRVALVALAAFATPIRSQIVDTALFREDDTRFTVLDQAESEPERRALRALLNESDLSTKDSLAEEFLSDFPASPLLAAVYDLSLIHI